MYMDVGKENLIYTLDNGVKFIPAKRCLVTSTGNTVELSENSYRLLLLLLEGETDKTNLINQVWIEQRGSVSESSYYGQLYLLRKSFHQADLSASLIKTIPRKGVKYVGYVASEMFYEPDPYELDPTPVDSLPIDDKSPKLAVSNHQPSSSTEHASLKNVINDWYHTRSWNIFVSALAVLAVCWLTTLVFAIFSFFKG